MRRSALAMLGCPASRKMVMARLRNLAIAILKLAGARNIAAACRSHARDATRVLATLGLSLQ